MQNNQFKASLAKNKKQKSTVYISFFGNNFVIHVNIVNEHNPISNIEGEKAF